MNQASSAPDIEGDLQIFTKSLNEIYKDFSVLLPYEERLKSEIEDDRLKQLKKESTSATISCDLAIVLDCTGSMGSWIQECKKNIIKIIHDVKSQFKDSKMRVACIAYRDHCDSKRIEMFQFISSKYELIEDFINSLVAKGGGDTPEDLAGALFCATHAINWTSTSRVMIVITDAPCHGKKFHDLDDEYPKGCPNYVNIESIIKEIAHKQIDLKVFDILPSNTDQMYSILDSVYKNIRYKPIHRMNLSDSSFVSTSTNAFANAITNTVMTTITESTLNSKHPGSSEDKYYKKAFQIIRAHKGLLNTACLSVTELELSLTTLTQKTITLSSETMKKDPLAIAEVDEEDSGEEEEKSEELQAETIEQEDNLCSFARIQVIGSANPKRYHENTIRNELESKYNTNGLQSMNPTSNWMRYFEYSDEFVTLICNCLTPFVVPDEGSSKINWCSPKVKMHQLTSKIKVLKKFFAEGALRYAFYAYDTLLNQQLVAKLHKNFPDNSNFALMKRDAMSLIACHYFAEEFNNRLFLITSNDQQDKKPQMLSFVDSSIYEVIQHPWRDVKYYLMENLIDGNYQKYNNNAGWTNVYDESSLGLLTQAFSHFTWQFSLGQLLAVDIQGGLYGVLTDPQIHTKNRSKVYGSGDLGYEGMLRFFHTHTCNEYCKKLSLIHPKYTQEIPEKFNFFSELFGAVEGNAETTVCREKAESVGSTEEELSKVESIITTEVKKKQKKKRGFALKAEREKERLLEEEEEMKKQLKIANKTVTHAAIENNSEINTICGLCKQVMATTRNIYIQNRKARKQTCCKECSLACELSLVDLVCTKCGDLFQISKYYCRLKKVNLIGTCEKCRND